MSKGTMMIDKPRISNNNLLDNWCFLNPVNQRGVSDTILTKGYFIDRWILVSGSVQLTPDGLLLDGEIQQKLEYSVNRKTSAAVLTTEGVFDAEYNDELKIFSISATGKTIVAAKLEIGSMQSLAYLNEDNTWVLNDYFDYQAELLKCYRYYQVLSMYEYNYKFVYGSSGRGFLTVQYNDLICPMRAVPTMSIQGIINSNGVDGIIIREDVSNNPKGSLETIEINTRTTYNFYITIRGSNLPADKYTNYLNAGTNTKIIADADI